MITKWVYKHLCINEAEITIEAELNKYGKEGWEVIAFWRGVNSWQHFAVMKRPDPRAPRKE